MPTTFKTTREGLDRRLVPMRLFAKAKTLGAWDPAAIDLTQDAADWAALTEPERDLLLRLSAQFGAGEESVTADLLPMLAWAGAAGRLEDQLFLTSYLYEEAKHVEAFDRFLREVAGVTGSLDAYLSPAHAAYFGVAQPAAMAQLYTDHSPEALVHALVTYQMGTEGVLAETGYHAYYTVLDRRNILPGMRRMIEQVQRDESRHVGYGVYLLSRLVAEHGEPLWQQVQAEMSGVVMQALAVVGEMLTPYGDDVPFGVSAGEFIGYAQGQFMKRMTRIEKALGRTVEEIDYGLSSTIAADSDAAFGLPASSGDGAPA